MVLETVMICLDNSEWMRNGDYSPSRLEAQSETVNYVANAKLNANQESNVGIMTAANRRIDVLVSPSRNIGQILNALKGITIGGKSNFSGALKTAQLALKNRTNKNQRQRIIMFVGSPVEDDVKELVKLGKNLKKNNVALDVINFGAENASNENAEKLEQLVNAVNSSDNSHLVNIPPGPHILADLVLTSAICVESGGASAGGAGVAAGGVGGMTGGIDPNMDPEMAMAIRMSMEEERQRQQKLAAEKGGAAASTGTGTGTAPASTPASAAVAAAADAGMEDDEEAQMAAAIALSMQTAEPVDTPMTDATQTQTSSADVAAAMQDPDFLNSLLSSVPGVNKDEIELDSILDELTSDTSKKDDDKKQQDKDKK